MSDNKKIRFGLWYDFRNPPQWRQPYDRLYSGTRRKRRRIIARLRRARESV